MPVIQMLWCLRDYHWLKGCKVTVCNCQWCVVYDALACDRKRDNINVRCWPRCICYNVTLLYSPVTQTLNQRTSVCHWYKLYDAIVHVCQQRKCNDVTACLASNTNITTATPRTAPKMFLLQRHHLWRRRRSVTTRQPVCLPMTQMSWRHRLCLRIVKLLRRYRLMFSTAQSLTTSPLAFAYGANVICDVTWVCE